MRKKLLIGFGIILSALTLQSCLNDDNTPKVLYGVATIDSINMPDTAIIGDIVKIKTYTQLKEKCQGFYTFDYNISANKERTVAIIVQQYDTECGEEKTIAPLLNFRPEETGNYTFKFLSGRDSINKKNIFITKDIYIKSKTLKSER